MKIRICARSKQAPPILTSCLTAKTDFILNIPFFWLIISVLWYLEQYKKIEMKFLTEVILNQKSFAI